MSDDLAQRELDAALAARAESEAAVANEAYQADYFAFDALERFYFPDGISYVELKKLNEGDRRKYQNNSNSEIRLGRGNRDASMKMNPGDDRWNLLKQSIKGWNLLRNGVPIGFNTAQLEKFLDVADPALVDRIEKAVRKLNPWLLSEMTVEQIDEEIRSLEEMRAVKVEEEAGKATS